MTEWVETAARSVPVAGDFGSDRPLALVVRGAFPAPTAYENLRIPNADVALLHLPGFCSPRVEPLSVEAFAAVFDEVIAKRFQGREITLVGVSTGCLVALAMSRPEIRGRVLVEPFFSTAKLWPLIEYVQGQLRRSAQPLLHAWCRTIFGYGLAAVEDRDYRPLAARDPSALAVVGSEPLWPRRPLTYLPSLTDAEDRRRFQALTYEGGHDAPLSAIAEAISQVSSATKISL